MKNMKNLDEFFEICRTNKQGIIDVMDKEL